MNEKTGETAVSRSKLASVLAAHEGECHVIVLQDFPDPDAISSALAHQLLSAAYSIGTNIMYNGRISHHQNIALVNLLDIHMIRFAGKLEGRYDGVVLVDNQGTTCQSILKKLEEVEVPNCDGDLLSKIMNQSRSKQAMTAIREALENRLLVENFSIAGVGYIRAESRDVIPQAADFLLTEENVHTVIVYGIVVDESQNEKLVGSLRSSRVTINPDTFIKEALGTDSNGRYYGGGKKAAAGFEIPLGFLSGNEDETFKELKWQTYDTQIKQKILAKIGVNTRDDESE